MAIFIWLWLVILIIIEVLWGTVSVIDIVKTIKFILKKDHDNLVRNFFYYIECYALVWVIVNTTILFIASLTCWGLQH